MERKGRRHTRLHEGAGKNKGYDAGADFGAVLDELLRDRALTAKGGISKEETLLGWDFGRRPQEKVALQNAWGLRLDINAELFGGRWDEVQKGSRTCCGLNPLHVGRMWDLFYNSLNTEFGDTLLRIELVLCVQTELACVLHDGD